MEEIWNWIAAHPWQVGAWIYVAINVIVAMTKSTEDDKMLRRGLERLAALVPLNGWGTVKLPLAPRAPLVDEPADKPKPPTGTGAGLGVVAIVCALSACGLSALDSTTRALGSYRVAHNLAVKSVRVGVTIKANAIARACIAEMGNVPECSERVSEYVMGWSDVAHATDTSALAAETLGTAVLRWAQAVDDGEGDDDEMPIDVQNELAAFCPKVGAWIDHLEAREISIPSLVTRGFDGVCSGR